MKGMVFIKLRDFSEDSFDIIIQAGQSNSEGCGVGYVESPFEPGPDVFQMDRNFIISTACEPSCGNDVRANFVYPFAREYIKSGKLKPGRKLLILLAAVGGTGFCDKRWGPEDDLFLTLLDMIKVAKELNPENRAVAFLWHQGESDANDPIFDKHVKNLSYLVKKVREAAGVNDLPFIAGDFVHHWKMKPENINRCEPIIAAIKDVCAYIGNGAFVETDGLTSNDEATGNGDDIHFSRVALYTMSERYFDAFMKLNN